MEEPQEPQENLESREEESPSLTPDLDPNQGRPIHREQNVILNNLLGYARYAGASLLQHIKTLANKGDKKRLIISRIETSSIESAEMETEMTGDAEQERVNTENLTNNNEEMTDHLLPSLHITEPSASTELVTGHGKEDHSYIDLSYPKLDLAETASSSSVSSILISTSTIATEQSNVMQESNQESYDVRDQFNISSGQSQVSDSESEGEEDDRINLPLHTSYNYSFPKILSKHKRGKNGPKQHKEARLKNSGPPTLLVRNRVVSPPITIINKQHQNQLNNSYESYNSDSSDEATLFPRSFDSGVILCNENNY